MDKQQQDKEKKNPRLFTPEWFGKFWPGLLVICLGLFALYAHLSSEQADQNPEGLLGGLVFIVLGTWYIVQKHRGV